MSIVACVVQVGATMLYQVGHGHGFGTNDYAKHLRSDSHDPREHVAIHQGGGSEDTAARRCQIQQIEQDTQYKQPLEHGKDAAKQMVEPSEHERMGNPVEHRCYNTDCEPYKDKKQYISYNSCRSSRFKSAGKHLRKHCACLRAEYAACDKPQHDTSERSDLTYQAFPYSVGYRAEKHTCQYDVYCTHR